MLKLLKWEIRKQAQTAKWILLFYAVLLALLAFLPKNLGKISDSPGGMFLFCCSMILIVGVVGFCIYPIYNMLGDFNKSYYELERTISKSYVYVLVIKLLINCCSYFISFGIGYAGVKVMSKFSTTNTTYFYMDGNTSFIEVIFVFAIVIPTLFLFCYMLSSALPIIKEHRSAGIVLGIIGLVASPKFLHFKGAAYDVFLIVSFIIMFILSVILEERYFEQQK